jgi:hypothetical protein
MTGKNFSFLIPLRIESPDRERNLKLCVKYLKRHLPACTIFVKESDEKPKFPKSLKSLVNYEFEKNSDSFFHRTRILNEMLFKVDTPIVSNYDVDVVLPPSTFYEAEKMILKENYDLVYPYGEGLCLWLVKFENPNYFEKTLDISSFKELEKSGTGRGHVHFLKTSSLRKGYMINENYISYGPEDEEFFQRFEKLGFKIGRVNDLIYHIEHSRTENSNNKNPFFSQNQDLYSQMKEMTGEQLREYMETQDYWKKYIKTKKTRK